MDPSLKKEAPDVETPTQFEEGFTLKTVLGAFFIVLLMLPGGMYLGLVAGQGVGDAAEWVTIVLFAEVARRSYKPLRRQEIYILFYMAASLTAVVNAERGLAGGPMSTLIWGSYFASSPAAEAFRHQIPTWAVPGPDSAAILERVLWHRDFWIPIALIALTDLCGRLAWMGMGYALFRVTRDVERLPFPYAPVAASGATALSEAGTESWRWRIFSTGAVAGVGFGLIYVAIPILASSLFGRNIQILPIPFADFSPMVQTVLPAAVVGLSVSLGNVLVGFILPFEIVLGAAISSVLAMIVMNPILHHFGRLPSYRPGSDAFLTKLSADMDFWLSFGIGINIAIAVLGIWLVVRSWLQTKRIQKERQYSLAPPPGRGDVPIWMALSVWLAATVTLMVTCHKLVPHFPVWILAFFGLVWSPLNSYISARMIGLTGRGVGFPYLREGSVIAAGYQRVDVWFAPLPLADHGWAAQRFREVELTGTKFTSIFKAEMLMFPLVLVASFAFWGFFWKANSVPSSSFPYAQQFWPIHAQIQAVMTQINLPGNEGNWFSRAIQPDTIAMGTGFGLFFAGACGALKIPLLFFYGFAGGIGIFPAYTLPQLLGAWIGKRHMRRRFGEEKWQRYAPVLVAGFSCGTGLIATASIAVALLAKAVQSSPY